MKQWLSISIAHGVPIFELRKRKEESESAEGGVLKDQVKCRNGVSGRRRDL